MSTTLKPKRVLSIEGAHSEAVVPNMGMYTDQILDTFKLRGQGDNTLLEQDRFNIIQRETV